jgi:hypothetical protein
MADELTPGFYYLTKLVTNPKPDRRSKRYDSAVAWAEGERVFVKPPRDGMVGQVEWRDGSVSYYGRVDADPIYGAANEVVKNLRPAEPTVGQFVKKANSTAAQLLAYFIGTNEISFNDLKRADADMSRDEFDLNAFEKKHEI